MTAEKTILFTRPYSFVGSAEDAYFQGLEHNAFLLGPYRRFLDVVKPATVLDVGANLGLTAILAHDAGAELIVAFEPSPQSYGYLARNVAANGVNAHLHNWAAGDRKASLRFHEAPFAAGSHVVTAQTVDDPQTIAVRSGPLDRFMCAMPKVDALKLDVEGFELAALKGARKLISTWRPSAYIELNTWTLIAFANKSPRDLIGAVRSAFPHVIWPLPEGGVPIASDSDVNRLLHANITRHGGVDDLIGTFDPGIRDALLAT